jgi:hypothetical protein
LTAKGRKSARQRGKSDPIDALNVARAALQEGLDCFPAAHLDGPELDLRCSSTTENASFAIASSPSSTLLWHLHDLWPELQLPGGALFSRKWTVRISRRLARAEQTMRVRIARDELRRLASSRSRSTSSSGRSPRSWPSSRRSCSPSRGLDR